MLYTQNSLSFLESIEYICRTTFEVLRTPIYFINKDKSISTSFYYGHAANPFHPDKSQVFCKLFEDTSLMDFPVIKSTEYLENYLGINLIINNILYGTFIVGPCTYSLITAEAVENLISEKNIPLGYKRELINYYNSLSIIDYKRFLNIGLLLYYSIYNKRLDQAEVMEKNSSIKNMGGKIQFDYENNISKNRQNSFFHHSLTHEMKIFGSIREGNRDKLTQFMQFPLDGEPGVLSKNNPLRSQKNHAICSVTLATRAAIEGGLNSETAFTLSDLYIQAIEELHDIKDLVALINKMLYDFADKVHEVKGCNYSRAIISCQNYIFKHLYEHISLSDLAEVVDLNPNYLSELFKKEMKITISEYIQKEKIQEAKRLLISSDYSLLEISSLLNFHDQSHFTRLFKKFTGTTPKRYKL